MACIAVRSLKTKDLIVDLNELLLLPQIQSQTVDLLIHQAPATESAMQRVLGVLDILKLEQLT